MAEKRPRRTLGPYHNTFWEYCGKEEFRLQKCNTCGRFEWPPTPMCPNCLGDEFTWTKISGQGKILTYCTFERQYYPECTPPWHAMLVQLDEGPLFMTNPKDIPVDDIKRGMPVKVTFIDCEDQTGQFKLPVFQKA